MSSGSPLLIDLAGVARLADVQRPVVSMWRTRFARTSDPFPAPHTTGGDRPLFEAATVASWLDRTRHGNNPDAVADAAASGGPLDFDIANASDVACVDALLTAHALLTDGVRAAGGDGLRSLAETHDPTDLFMSTELSLARPAWITWAEQLADAAYSPSGASLRLERRHSSLQAAGASAGPLTIEAEELLATLVDAIRVQHPVAFTVAGVSPSLASRLASTFAGEPVVADAPGARAIRRRLILDGLLVPGASESIAAPAPRVSVVRLPQHTGADVAQTLDAVNDLVLQMRDGDLGVVLAPAGVLADRVSRDDERLRSDALRSGRVRAMVKLPAGLITSAPREALVLWVLGSELGNAPIGERVIAVADLSDATLTPAARADLAGDVVALLGGARDARRHSFRFARLVRTSSVLASRGALTLAGRPRRELSSPRDLPARLDVAWAALGDDAPAVAPVTAASSALLAKTIDELIADRTLRVLPGVRLSSDEFLASGLVVVGAHDLDAPEAIGARFVDPLDFAERHPSARVTEPGDVVFRTSPTARAWVDTDGSKVVAHPARVLRIRTSDPDGLVPELIALDIEGAPAGPGAWRRWQLRRVAAASVAPLRATLAELAAGRAALQARVEALDHYAELLTSAVAAGVVTVPAPTAPTASDH